MSKEVKKLKILNYIIWSLVVILIILFCFWFYPRNTVDVISYETEKLNYRIGDELYVLTESEIFFNGNSNYDVRLICDGGRYLLKSFEVTSVVSERKPGITKVGIIPLIPTPDNCVIRTQATHEIQIMPYITRTYTNVWETNRFLVEAKE